MALLTIDTRQPIAAQPAFALLQLGFRPLFLAGISFAIIAMLLWTLQTSGIGVMEGQTLPNHLWHAHEMIFGYALAIVIGFLLTAVQNWTGVATIKGKALAVMVIFWLLARFAMWWHAALPLWLVALPQLVFILMALVAFTQPVIQVKQWSQGSISAKIAILAIAELLFFLGMNGSPGSAIYWGLYSGLYTILAIALLMMRRVVPFFIERGTQGVCRPVNRRWVDISSLILFTLFAVSDVFALQQTLTSLLAILLAILHLFRLYGWYHPVIWRYPLLWVLILAYLAMITGFLLHGLVTFGLSHSLATHAIGVGSLGLITAGMIARVTLGHTGRDINTPPAIVKPIFLLLLLAMLLRLLLPSLVATEHYFLAMLPAQICWISAFSLLLWQYGPMLVKPRVDGKAG
ncbi:MAG: NnrS family protein [Gammaproteobacteria bacterium]|nr:NnrS family protein [Gammaproteobacteria bacterium]